MSKVTEKTKSRELTVGGGRVEAAERRFGKHLEKAAYGVTLRGSTVELWKDEGGRRTAVRTERLSDGEAEQVRDAALRVKNFTPFATLFFYLLHLGKKLI